MSDDSMSKFFKSSLSGSGVNNKALLIVGVILMFIFGSCSVLVGTLALTSMGHNELSFCLQQNGSDSGSSGSGPVDSKALFDAQQHYSAGDNRLMVSLLVGTHLESNWKSRAVGAGSYGAYQIQGPIDVPPPYRVVHPDITIAQAVDPAYATQYMAGSYRSALNYDGIALLWILDPERAAEETASGAERPAVNYYESQGTAAVHAAFVDSLAVMKQRHISTDFSQNGIGSIKLADVKQTAAQSVTNEACAPNGGQLPPGADRHGRFAQQAKAVINAAVSQLGVPYVWGGESPKPPAPGAFDCSGLTQWSFLKIGIDLSHNSQQQYDLTKGFTVVRHGQPLTRAEPGDLVFFHTLQESQYVTHVGLYVGNNRMINAPRTGEFVSYADLTDPYWQNALVAITDPFLWQASQGS